MNRVEMLEDGTTVMIVKVDGEAQSRRCNVEMKEFLGGGCMPRIVPEVRDNEHLMETLGGGFEIITIS